MLGGDAAADLRLRSPELDVGVSPLSGGSITAITHSATGLEVLWRTPWAERAPAAEPGRVLDVGEWCACSRGGWQVAFPNAGDACEWAGVRHGFHGEASMAEWAVADVHEGSVLLKLDLASLPISIERLITVSGATVTVRDAATNTSAAPVEVMWTQHPGLGGDLLDGPVTLQTNAAVFQLDDQAAVVGIDARPGQTACWPVLGETDLRHPADHGALLGYLREFDGPPWVDLSRDDGSLGIRLTWDADVYPYCWLWQELGGTQGEPWRGQARVIGIEPAASWPGQGLARVAASTGTALRIGPGATVAGEVALTVCVGAGQTTAVAGDVALTVRAGAGQTTEGPR